MGKCFKSIRQLYPMKATPAQGFTEMIWDSHFGIRLDFEPFERVEICFKNDFFWVFGLTTSLTVRLC